MGVAEIADHEDDVKQQLRPRGECEGREKAAPTLGEGGCEGGDDKGGEGQARGQRRSGRGVGGECRHEHACSEECRPSPHHGRRLSMQGPCCGVGATLAM